MLLGVLETIPGPEIFLTGGGLGIVVFLVLRVLKHLRETQTAHVEEIKELRRDHVAEIQAMRTEHAQERGEAREQFRAMLHGIVSNFELRVDRIEESLRDFGGLGGKSGA